MALVGLGGIGYARTWFCGCPKKADSSSKSQLAIEFAYRIADEAKRWEFWIHAGTQARVEEGFRAIADVVKLPGRNQPKADIPQLVYSWLSDERNGRWVVILDSADDRDVFYAVSDGREGKPLASYFPQSRNGSILVTTRNRDLAYRLTGNHEYIEVGPMVVADALLLLEKKLGLLSDTDMANDLVQALDFVPLAISQAAAYIQARSPMSSVEKYLAEFRKGERKQALLLTHDAGDLRRDGGASNAILTTLQISFDHIRSQRPSAADLLSLMSFFDRQGISLSLLKPVKAEGILRVAGLDRSVDSESESGRSDESDSSFEDDVTTLRDFCLVATNEDGSSLEMHGLVQLSMRRWLESDGLQDKFRQQFVERIAAAFPPGDYSNWATCQQLFSHVEAAVDQRPSKESMQESWASLMHNGGGYAWLQGRYEVAERMVGKAQKNRKKRSGEDDKKTLASMLLLGSIFLDKGLWEKAELVFVQVMETSKRVLGEEHPSTLTSMANLASTYKSQGRWKEAEELQAKDLEICSRVLGEEHPDTLTNMANLASTYKSQGRWKEAKSLEVQVMETRKRVMGEEHPDTLISMVNLASTYQNQGRWKEAESLGLQVLETSSRVLGEHPFTLTSMGNLASTYRNQGRWKEAESLEVQVMETRKRVMGEEHPDTLISMVNLASTYQNQGRWKEAESLEVQVIETRKRVLGEEHPDTLISMANLASTYQNQGRWKEAESLGLQVTETFKRVLGEEHPNTLTSMANLASTYWNQGQKEAESLEVQVMETRKRVLGEEHPDTLTSMYNLAFTWKGQGRHADALALMTDCAQAQQRILGPDHPYTVSSLLVVAVWGC